MIEKIAEQSTEGLGITLGNLFAKRTLIKVCNPYCGPSAKAHAEIEKLLEENKDLKVQIIFAATNNENDYRNKLVKHLLAIAKNNNEQKIKQSLDDRYLADKKRLQNIF
jgi:DNA polymerase III delta subunit